MENFLLCKGGIKLRINQIKNDLTRIELSKTKDNECLISELMKLKFKFKFVKEHKYFYEITYKGSFSEAVHVLELINKIKIYNCELDRLINK